MPFTVFTPENTKEYYYQILKQMKPTDIAWAYNHTNLECGSYSAENMRLCMKAWRILAKLGDVRIEEFNDRTKTIDGKEWHFLVVQTTDPSENLLDPIGMCLYGFTVSGTIYSFKSKDNRDKIRKYVMKNIN